MILHIMLQPSAALEQCIYLLTLLLSLRQLLLRLPVLIGKLQVLLIQSAY